MDDIDEKIEEIEREYSKKIFFLELKIVALCCLLMVVSLALPYIDENVDDTNSGYISVKTNVVKLGTEVDLLNLIDYDKNIIKEVEIYDNGGFDNGKVGIYDVGFQVTNADGEVRNVTKEFIVEDGFFSYFILKDLYLKRLSNRCN